MRRAILVLSVLAGLAARSSAGENLVFNPLAADSTPTNSALPYVKNVQILPASHPPPICGGDSIRVMVSGVFPLSCFDLERIDLIQPVIRVVAPPIVRLIISAPPCSLRFCPTVLKSFSGEVTLPPLPPFDYRLEVQVAETICTSAGSQDTIHSAAFPFHVDGCEAFHCLLGTWVRSPDPRLAHCNAWVAPGNPAVLTYGIHTPVALAGLQGSFFVQPQGLKIVSLVPIGPATGMNLSWTGRPDGGADYVLFAERGAPIPPSPDSLPAAPVLRVVLQVAAGQEIPGLTTVIADAFGADAEGGGVPHCPTFAPIAATVCLLAECDHNRDGRLDVRDLVLMIRCLNGEGPCADLSVLDCTRDGAFGLDDVICCARHILRGSLCPNCSPDTTQPRHEPAVRLSLGEPIRIAGAVQVPIKIEAPHLLGAVRLDLAYPADRYQLSALTLEGNRPGWLSLHEEKDGKLVVGLIRTATAPAAEIAETPLEVLVDLSLVPGTPGGGEISAVETDFSGPDGVRLIIETDRLSQPLTSLTSLSLSHNRPDPFARKTSFSITVGNAADVVLSIYDVGGRRITTLFRGRLEAGVHPFTWNGARSDGSRARSGIYFYRATAKGQSVARKMVLLQD